MRLLKWIIGLFQRQRSYICGGTGNIEIEDNFGRVVGRLFFERPNSEMRLNYTYEYQDISSRDTHLREIKSDKESGGNVSRKIHEIVERDLYIPYANKIFSHSELYFDSNKKPIDNADKEKQFNFIKEYFSHHLVAMVSLAFEDSPKYKKKA